MEKKNKYNAVSTIVDGIRFDSKLEAEYYAVFARTSFLKWERQVTFELIPPFEVEGKKYRAIKYIADFVFYDEDGKILKVVDVKGVITPSFRIKAKLFAFITKHRIIIATKKNKKWHEI